MKLERDGTGWFIIPMEFFHTNYTWREYARRKDHGLPIETVR
jgi:hypothetical protein